MHTGAHLNQVSSHFVPITRGESKCSDPKVKVQKRGTNNSAIEATANVHDDLWIYPLDEVCHLCQVGKNGRNRYKSAA